jgi:hypothetical protein
MRRLRRSGTAARVPENNTTRKREETGGKVSMKKFSMAVLAVSAAAASVIVPTAAFAQKPGGILKVYHRGNPPSASIHEEATTSTVMPFSVVFNNLVWFDQKKPLN